MLWLAVTGPGTTDVSPIDAATSSVLGYVLSFGPLGLIVIAFGWLLFRGWKLLPPSEQASLRGEARAEGRADLMAENERLREERRTAEEQRDEALKFTRDQVTPLLASFNATTSALIPILQDLIRDPPSRRRRGGADS